MGDQPCAETVASERPRLPGTGVTQVTHLLRLCLVEQAAHRGLLTLRGGQQDGRVMPSESKALTSITRGKLYMETEKPTRKTSLPPAAVRDVSRYG